MSSLGRALGVALALLRLAASRPVQLVQPRLQSRLLARPEHLQQRVEAALRLWATLRGTVEREAE